MNTESKKTVGKPKGSQKSGGRQKGSLNKTTTEIREMYQQLISNNLELLQEDIEQLEPFQRLKIIIELTRFVIPALKQTEMVIDAPDVHNVLNLGSGINPEEFKNEVTKIINDLEDRY